jgi:asparagine synthase (glutamine-hydrolysing)
MEQSYDEAGYAQLVSRHQGTEHYEVICGANDFIELLPHIIWHADNLLADASLLPMYMVSRLAGQHVKVVLSGDGADELFAGYSTYKATSLLRWYRLLPPFVKHLISATTEMIPTSTRKMSFDYKAKKFTAGADYHLEKAHYFWRTIFTEKEKRLLFLPHWKHIVKDSFYVYKRFYEENEDWDDLSRHQYADLKVWMVDSILAKVDTMGMAHSLEARVPFLDHQLVEFAATIPARFRRNLFTTKLPLREAVDGRLPHSIVHRHKEGFMMPVADWIRNEAREMVQDVLSPSYIKNLGYFNPTFVEQLIEDHLNLQRDNGLKLLSLLSFCLRHEIFTRRHNNTPYRNF